MVYPNYNNDIDDDNDYCDCRLDLDNNSIWIISMSLDVDQHIANLRKGMIIPETHLRLILEKLKEILMEESNVQPIRSPVTVCGDIHGQFYDLLELFRQAGEVPITNYIFIGDFVDRGYNSVETFQMLCCLKLRYPGNITLLRGNHESR